MVLTSGITVIQVDQIIMRGCGALKQVLGQRQNSALYLRFLLTSLETR